MLQIRRDLLLACRWGWGFALRVITARWTICLI